MIARLQPRDALWCATLLLLVLAALALPASSVAWSAKWDCCGISGLVMVALTSVFWMLPRALDSAVTDPLIAIAKYVSVPFLIGLPLAMSWPRMTFIVRGVFLLESIATFFRLGWLFLVSPERLCNLYLLEDQQRLGQSLLLVGAAFCLWIAWKLVFGRFASLPAAAVAPR